MDYKITPSEFFINYEEDFSKQTYQIKAFLDQSRNNPLLITDLKLKELTGMYNDAQSSLKQMELELMSLPQQSRVQLQTKVRGYKGDLENLSRQIQIAENSRNNNRNGGELFGDSENPKERFLNEGGKIYSQTKKIEEAKKNMLECEDTAINVQRELHKNTGTLEKAIKNTKEVWNEFSKSNRLVTMMNNRRIRNKMVLYVVMGVVFLGILLILFMNFK